ncbi:response regulator [uncultured Jannaschia sp.]|uniref:response regulator n=1 Tax=uncultured Jannaschia sp. TaxID=293347 RepID=UPI002623D129|nr:response regulator [uncultured Jannaschia sp.]
MTQDETGLQIVVVEDETLIMMDLELMIEAEGHRMVADASSVRTLCAIDTDLHVDLAFVDLQLAEKSCGLDAADYIRATWPEALIVFVTANPRLLLPEIERGDGVVPKPFSSGVIEAVLAFLHGGIRTPPPVLAAPNGFFMRSDLATRLGCESPAARAQT